MITPQWRNLNRNIALGVSWEGGGEFQRSDPGTQSDNEGMLSCLLSGLLPSVVDGREA